jgi:hypothetical protein
VLDEYAQDDTDRFVGVMGILAKLAQDGQETGEVRPGNPDAIAHLSSALVNEFVLISVDQAVTDPFTIPQFHALSRAAAAPFVSTVHVGELFGGQEVALGAAAQRSLAQHVEQRETAPTMHMASRRPGPRGPW